MYLEDFDGIVADALAFPRPDLTWGVHINLVTGLNTSDPSFVTYDKWNLDSTYLSVHPYVEAAD